MSNTTANQKVNILHMGLGAFHRAHQAVYVQRAINNGQQLAIAAVSQRDPKEASALAELGFKYVVRQSDGASSLDEEITSIVATYFYPTDYAKLGEIVADEDFLAITITATEKAYVYSDDLQATLPGRLAYLLHERFLKTKTGIAVISCDNLSGNGAITKGLVLKSAGLIGDAGFINWIEKEIRFPNTMVDRIVPATKEPRVLITEPFMQWVIEKDPIEKYLGGVGIQFVDDVAGYELMKLRLFNAVHSALAYIGELGNIEYVSQVIAEPRYEQFVIDIQEQAASSFVVPKGESASDYSAAIRKRIANPVLGHRSQQIAMDGSQKLPHRVYKTINDLIEKGLPTNYLSLLLAIWVDYLSKSDRINDPLKDKLIPLARTKDVAGIFSLPEFAVKLNPKAFTEIQDKLSKIQLGG
jgi:fructuronate reductase